MTNEKRLAEMVEAVMKEIRSLTNNVHPHLDVPIRTALAPFCEEMTDEERGDDLEIELDELFSEIEQYSDGWQSYYQIDSTKEVVRAKFYRDRDKNITK